MRKVAVLFALVVSQAALAGTPSEGVPLQVRKGFFTETDIGLIVDLGGNGQYGGEGASNGYSNANPYLQLGVGYQLNLSDRLALPIGLNVGIGANASNCYGAVDNAGNCVQSDNFTLTFITGTVGVLYSVFERFYLGGKLLGGYTLIDPAATVRDDNSAVTGAPHFGIAASAEYFTNMDHFAIGVDVIYRLVIGPNIHSLQPFFRVKYTF